MMGRGTKQPMPPKAEPFPRKAIPCDSGPSDDEKGRAYANLIHSPELAAYRVIGMMQPKYLGDGIDVPTMMATLRDQAAAVQGGDLAHAEAMLINQASALQAMFVRLSERAMEQSQMPNLDGFMRLALRAQSQCRTTLETLAEIKNPRAVAFVRQANIANGPQQVNNGNSETSTHAHAGARETQSKQTQLSGGTHELLPNARTSGDASRVDPKMETLGAIDRAEIRRG